MEDVVPTAGELPTELHRKCVADEIVNHKAGRDGETSVKF